jgi:hydroxypyruvate isomerase
VNRREFHRNLAGAALGFGVPGLGISGGAQSPGQQATAEAPFKISIMLWTVFRKLRFEERLEKVAEAGYRNVELVGEFEKWSESDWRNVLAKKRELGITFDTTGGVPNCNEKVGLADPSARESMLEGLRNILPACERLGCRRIILMSGNVVPGLSHKQQHESCIEGLKRAAEIVEGKDFELLVENIDPEEDPGYFLTSVAEGFEIIRAVNNPQVRFLYDFYHEQIAEGNLIEKLEKNIDLIGVCHVADVPGRHEPGTGEINYINIYKKLVSLGYDRYVAMEYLPTNDPVESLRAAHEQALRAPMCKQALWTPRSTG